MNFEDYFPIKKHIDHCNKLLGQHFLMDRNILNKISNSIDFSFIRSKHILEIGGGIGNLTIYLSQKNFNNYTIIEKDEYYVNYLKSLFPQINVIHGDCLDYNGKTDIIVGNLPYNVATKFIQKIIINNQCDESLFLIQKEVAERIVSKPKSKSYGVISVLAQCLTEPKILFNVSGNSFFPKPNVMSSVIYFKHKQKTIDHKFVNFLYNSFKHRRKKYYNNLCPDQISPEIYELLFNQKSNTF